MDRRAVRKFSLKGMDPLLFYGHNDANILLIENEFDQVKIMARGDEVTVDGLETEVEKVIRLFYDLSPLIKKGEVLNPKEILAAIEMVKSDGKKSPKGYSEDTILISNRREDIRPKTIGQYHYVEAMRNYDVVFAIGPAGTGKTYLAVAMAVAALMRRDVSRIVLARPAVEAGETLGFLPGDLKEKLDPYLRPIYDALYDMVPPDKLRRLIETNIIEIVPLAYMRGRTLNNAYVILDEAQNTTVSQMKMFLTRLGVNSKAIVTGDITQVDLPEKSSSGLIRVQSILAGVSGVKFVYLSERDVVRHKLVQEVIKAFEEYEAKQTET